MGKSHALPFKLSRSHALHPLNLVHTDLWGLSPINCISGHKYYISFLDDYSRYVWLFPLKAKSEADHAFVQFKNFVEKQFDRKSKVLQSDGGAEFNSFNNITQREGILFRHSCPYTSMQNVRVERKHISIVETGLVLLANAKMPLCYWVEAFQICSD